MQVLLCPWLPILLERGPGDKWGRVVVTTDTQQPKDLGNGSQSALDSGCFQSDKETPVSASATRTSRPHAGDPWRLCFLTWDMGLLAPAGHSPCTRLPPAVTGQSPAPLRGLSPHISKPTTNKADASLPLLGLGPALRPQTPSL